MAEPGAGGGGRSEAAGLRGSKQPALREILQQQAPGPGEARKPEADPPWAARSRTGIDIQSTDSYSGQAPHTGFWTHVSQISLAAFKRPD